MANTDLALQEASERQTAAAAVVLLVTEVFLAAVAPSADDPSPLTEWDGSAVLVAGDGSFGNKEELAMSEDEEAVAGPPAFGLSAALPLLVDSSSAHDVLLT